MPRKPIPNWIKRGIVKLWLQGFGRLEISKRVGYSTGAVWNVVNEFREKAKEPSLEEAARIYEVGEDLDTLRQIASYIRSWMSIEEAKEGFKISGELRNAGVKPNNLSEFLNLYKTVIPHNFPVKAFISSAINLHEIVKGTGLSPQEIPVRYGKMRSELKDLTVKVEALKVEVRDLEEKRSQAIELERRASKAKRELAAHDASIRRLEARKKSLEEGIADAVAKGKVALDRLHTEISQLSERAENLRGEKEGLEKEVKAWQDMESEAKRRCGEMEERLEGYKALKPLSKLMVNCDGEPHEVLPVALMVNEGFCEWLKTHEPKRPIRLKHSLDDLLEEIKREIGFEH